MKAGALEEAGAHGPDTAAPENLAEGCEAGNELHFAVMPLAAVGRRVVGGQSRTREPDVEGEDRGLKGLEAVGVWRRIWTQGRLRR